MELDKPLSKRKKEHVHLGVYLQENITYRFQRRSKFRLSEFYFATVLSPEEVGSKSAGVIFFLSIALQAMNP